MVSEEILLDDVAKYTRHRFKIADVDEIVTKFMFNAATGRTDTCTNDDDVVLLPQVFDNLLDAFAATVRATIRTNNQQALLCLFASELFAHIAHSRHSRRAAARCHTGDAVLVLAINVLVNILKNLRSAIVACCSVSAALTSV